MDTNKAAALQTPFFLNPNQHFNMHKQLYSLSWTRALLLGTTRPGCPFFQPIQGSWGMSSSLGFPIFSPHFNCKIIPPASKATQPLLRTGTSEFCRISHSHTQSRRQPVWKIYINPLRSNTRLYKSQAMQNTKQTRSTLELVGDTINTGNSRLSRKSPAPSKRKKKVSINSDTICSTKRNPGPAPSPNVWSWFCWGQISSTAYWQ